MSDMGQKRPLCTRNDLAKTRLYHQIKSGKQQDVHTKQCQMSYGASLKDVFIEVTPELTKSLKQKTANISTIPFNLETKQTVIGTVLRVPYYQKLAA
jgi:hypothetical protein